MLISVSVALSRQRAYTQRHGRHPYATAHAQNKRRLVKARRRPAQGATMSKRRRRDVATWLRIGPVQSVGPTSDWCTLVDWVDHAHPATCPTSTTHLPISWRVEGWVALISWASCVVSCWRCAEETSDTILYCWMTSRGSWLSGMVIHIDRLCRRLT